MSKENRLKIEKVFDVLGEIIAVLALIIFVVSILNYNFNFVKNADAVKILEIANEWSGFLLIAVVVLEATIKRNIVIRIIALLLIAIAVIFLFFPGTYNTLIDKANSVIDKVKVLPLF